MKAIIRSVPVVVLVMLAGVSLIGCSTAPRLPQQSNTVKNQAVDQRQLAETALQRNQLEQAGTFYSNSLQLSQRVDHGRGVGEALLGLGKVALLGGDPARAAAYGAAAERVAGMRVLPEQELRSAILRAEAAIAAGDSQAALQLLAEAEDRAGDAVDARSAGLVLLLHTRGTALRHAGDYSTAETLLIEAREQAERLQDVAAAAAAAYQLASVYVHKNELSRAMDAIDYALRLDQQMENSAAIASSLEAGAAILERQGRSVESARYLERAYGVYQGIGDAGGLQRVRDKLADSRGDFDLSDGEMATIWESGIGEAQE